jgi:dTDP-3-amino-3,4,6-trideoxy-alpha-D-glucose transaminase
VYHLFVVRTSARDALQAHLASLGVGTLIHYPVPVHRQPAFADLAAPDCPEAERLCTEVLSLPLHPALSDDQQQAVIDGVLAFRVDTARPIAAG